MRGTLTALCLICAASAVAQDPLTRYARGDVGQAFGVPWLGLRVGRSLDRGTLGLDLGLSGSPTERGAAALTAGLEARGWFGSRVSPFGRVEIGAMFQSQGQDYGLASVGGGLAVRVDRSWALRAGITYSLGIGDWIRGPDYAFVGIERRW